MVAGQVTRKLTEFEDNNTREYGWHFVCSSPFQPNSESNHVTASVSHYYDLSYAQQSAGIYDVIYREYLIDFLFPPKMSNQQIHLVAYRAKRGHDSAIGKAFESVKSVKVSQLLSLASMHKMFFLLLMFLYFANRFVCGKYDRIDYDEKATTEEDASSNSELLIDNEMGYVESM